MSDGGESGWVAEAVYVELDEPSVGVVARVVAWLSSNRRWTLSLGPSLALVLVGAVLYFMEPNAGESLAPASGAHLAVWAVYASTVALTLPLLLLVIEQAGDEGLVAVRRAEVLLNESGAQTTSFVTLPAIAALGVNSLYFDRDAVLLLAILVFVAALALILRGYWQTIYLLTHPAILAAKSEDLLITRLQDAVKAEFVVRASNDRILAGFDKGGADSLGSAVAKLVAREHQVVSPTTGWVKDVNLPALRTALAPLRPSKGPDLPDIDSAAIPVHADPPPQSIDLPRSDSDGGSVIIYLALVGDKVLSGRPLVVVEGMDRPVTQDESTAVHSAYRIEPHA